MRAQIRMLVALAPVLLLVACATNAPVASSQPAPRPKPKRYTATPLPDGRIQIVVTGRTGLPSGDEVKTIDLRQKLDAAAAQECPQGHALDADPRSALKVAPGGQGFVATLTGLIRCR